MSRSNVISIKPKLPNKAAKGLKLLFGDSSEKILEMLQQDDTESGVLLAQKQMLITTLSMIPDAEKAVKSSEGSRGIYQYVQLINLAQSQIETIKAQMDVGLVADSICANSVHPTFLSLAQHVVTSMYRLRSELRDFIKAEDRPNVKRLLDDTIRGMAAYMEEQNKDLQSKIRQRISDF